MAFLPICFVGSATSSASNLPIFLSDELASSYVRTATLRSAGSDAASIDYIPPKMSIKIWYLGMDRRESSPANLHAPRLTTSPPFDAQLGIARAITRPVRRHANGSGMERFGAICALGSEARPKNAVGRRQRSRARWDE